MPKRIPTTKSIALLQQLQNDGQLTLAPEFQRNSVWPRQAKAYLIDTILNDRPIPLLYFQRFQSPQTGRQGFVVIDGQQRLRAIFDFLGDRFALTESLDKRYKGRRFSELRREWRDHILDYDLAIQELSGYTDKEIRDIFVRMNRYVVKLSPQELRHAERPGRFGTFVEELGQIPFWREQRVFTPLQFRRMKPVEFSAELAILLLEGPQDKKSAVDVYYEYYQTRFPQTAEISTRLGKYLRWISDVLPDLSRRRYRKPVDLYALIGALDDTSDEARRLSRLDRETARRRLIEFEQRTRAKRLGGDAAAYVVAASRQTDNVIPRQTRIRILSGLISD